MISVNTHETKTRLSELPARVENESETVLICRNGAPVAKLVPWGRNRNPLVQSEVLKSVEFVEDPSLPLTEEDWPGSVR